MWPFYIFNQEIGYTDTILDVRSNKVRTLLGLNNEEQGEESNYRNCEKQQHYSMNTALSRKMYDYGMLFRFYKENKL